MHAQFSDFSLILCSLLVETEHWHSNHLFFEVSNAEV